jgi:5-methylcytosine-specific restriction protein A
MTHNYVIELEYLKSKENILDSNIKIKSSNEIIDLLQKYKSKLSGKRIVSSIYFERNTIIKEYVKRRAKGKCELCNENAPFRDSKGIPYLEVHHIVWLSRNGEDSIENTGA